MLLLTIGNSESNLDGLSISEFRDLKQLLSYEDQSTNFSRFSNKKYLIDRHGNFGSGLLPLVKTYLNHFKIEYKTVDVRIAPKHPTIDFKLSLPFTPHQWQFEAIRTAVDANRGTISACTGSGKSLVIAMIVHTLGLKTLVVVPTLQLKKQLSDTFTQLFGSLKGITIENIDSKVLKYSPTDIKYKYDVLIIDECHRSASKTYQELNKKSWNDIYYRFYLTATPFRTDSEQDLLLESIAGQVIYSIDYKTALKERLVAPIEAYYIQSPRIKIKGKEWREVYSELVVNNEPRNRLIADLLRKFHVNNEPTLCLVKEIQHGDNIRNLCGAAFANGQSDDCSQFIEWFNKGKLRTLIGTTGVLGEGIDTKPCQNVIIAGLGKSKGQFQQSIGRAIRLHPNKSVAKVIIISDNSHKWTKAHLRSQLEVLKDEYGVVPALLEV